MPTDQDVTKWIEEVDAVARLIGPRFGRRNLRVHSANYLRGLISRIERKNGWQLAEELGQQTPTNLQHFVARSRWSADEVRDDLRQYVVEHLGSKDGVLIVDETGLPSTKCTVRTRNSGVFAKIVVWVMWLRFRQTRTCFCADGGPVLMSMSNKCPSGCGVNSRAVPA